MTQMRQIGAQKLLYGQNPLANLVGDQTARGAISPEAARDTMTREAIRRREARRKALRSGPLGLLRAIEAI